MAGCQRWLDAGAWAGAWRATVGLLEGGGERCRRLARLEERYPQHQAPGAFFSSWFAVNGELVIKHCVSRAMVLGPCLTKNGYKEERCQSVIKALYECCEVFYDRYGDDATSPSCPKPKLLRLKLEQLKDR
ncbi:unnamed protein product [Clonostachys rhizophaga]|uniref:Cx9C motif-containing protein 4, mitochondrial n=1 Tax=Clonostachys rhizophaga TaxID=160324 RepID=A0A9N9V7Z2_9HYPO|nr:unnamed protein product [Clonostachys rhizophaga]